MKQTRTATMKSIDIREKLGEPTEIHFNYTGEVFRLGNGSAPSLKMQADQLVDKLNSNTNPDMNPLGYFVKYRFVPSEIMSKRSYEIRKNQKCFSCKKEIIRKHNKEWAYNGNWWCLPCKEKETRKRIKRYLK